MSIRIEVTGTSIGEVADKLLAIGHSLQNTAINNADNAAREALQAERKAKAPRKKAEPDNGVALNAVAHPVNETPVPEDIAPEALEVVEVEVEVAEEAPADPTPQASASEPELDFEKDVAPVVIDAVSRVGREGVSSTLAEFGVDRASEVDPSQYAELVKALEAL